MKLNSNTAFILFSSCIFILLFTLTIQTETKTESNKKVVSSMEFYNSFYSSDKKAESLIESTKKSNINLSANSKEANEKKHKKKLHSRKSHKTYRFKQAPADGKPKSNCSSLNGESYTQVLRVNSTNTTEFPLPTDSGIYIEGDLFISSEVFRNKERYPSINLLNGTEQEIKIDEDNFRINDMGCEPNSCKLNFYFRLAPNLHIYYASSSKDLNVIGSVSIQNILKVGDPQNPILTVCGEAYCFELEDTVNSNWKLCASSWKRAMKWVCAIKKELGMPDPTCDDVKRERVQILEKRVREPIIVIPTPSRHCNEAWNYQKQGEDWECGCSEGKEQSPIDLPLPEDAIDSPVRPLFTYNEIEAKSHFDTIDKQLAQDEPVKIQIFEGAIKIMHHNFGKVTTIDGAVYHAEEIIFHTPSEHTVNGKRYDMEVQIIHYGQSKGDIAKQLVFSFLVEKKPGMYNKFFDDIDIFNLPEALAKSKDITNSLYIPKLLFKSEEEEVPMMKPFSFYTYQGSLTFPPCSERTIHYVVSKPIQLSSTTLTLFQEALRIPDLVDQKGNVIVTDWVPQSNRNIQPLNGRPVFYYDHIKYCGPDPINPKPKPAGHYEKVVQKATSYFYVNGEKPSGLPGSFVVSENEASGKTFSNIQA